MKILNIGVLNKFLKRHRTDKAKVSSGLYDVENAEWLGIENLRLEHVNIREISNSENESRVVFKLGHSVRIDTLVFWIQKIVMIKRIGTHEDYNKWKY